MAQFFTSETVTSDVQLRQSIIWVLAFVLVPCLLLLFTVFPQFQLLVIRVGRSHPPPGVITRATAVRNIMGEDMIEWAVAMLVGYSAITMGLVAVFEWDALSFDRRDAMVLGPLPLRGSTVVLSKLGALAAFLLGASLSVNTFNAIIFALETSDQFGFGALIAHFVACLVVTTAAATLVFSSIVTVRGVAGIAAGPRLTTALGSLLQFLAVLLLLTFFLALIGTPSRQRRLGIRDLGSEATPLSWFVAAFEVLRRSERGSWSGFTAMARYALLAVPASMAAAVLTSVAAYRRQMRAALTPNATPSPIGRARVSRAVARLMLGGDKPARAAADFILTTIARNRAQQAPIAFHVALAVAMSLAGFARARAETQGAWLVLPLLLAYWTLIGVRAAFFVPSELAGAWTFHANAPEDAASYRAAVRASLIGFAAPSLTVLAILVGGVAYGGRVLLLLATLAQCVAATVDFVPFTRPYRPGHAKLKTRWPLYVVGAYAFSYGLVRTPIWLPIVIIAVVEAVARRRARRWSLQPGPDEDDEPFAVTRLDLSGSLQRAVAVLLVLATSAWAHAPAGRVGDDLTPRHATAASGSLSCR